MIKDRVAKAINEQINAEFYSAFLYLSMSAHFQGEDLGGFASWMNVQFQEEQFHALKFFNYLAERGGKVELETIEKPEISWESPIAVFEETLAHERVVTGLINNLMDIALEERDHATVSFLGWFIDEQVEEESTAEGILNQLKRINGEGNGLFMIDKELGARVFTPPAE